MRSGKPGEPTRAVVLRSVDFGESDRILTLLTDRHGRISAIARGARKSAKRFGGALEPFAILEATVALGSGDVGRLAEARVLRAFPRLLASLDAMREAGHGLELVRKVAPQREGEPRLVDAVEALFEELDPPGGGDSGPAWQGAAARCVLRVLAIVGLAPRLDACVGCGLSPEPRQAALFDPVRGGIVCRACGGGPLRLSGRARAWMQAGLVDEGPGRRSEPPRASLTAEDRSEVSAALDAFVSKHVG